MSLIQRIFCPGFLVFALIPLAAQAQIFANQDQLLEGSMTLTSYSAINSLIPVPAFPNQKFCSLVTLATTQKVQDIVAAARVGRGPISLVEVRGIRRVRPRVAIHAYLAIAVEIVEDNILSGQRVLVGSYILAKDGQPGIAVGAFEVTEFLIVGTVFLDDVNHMLDWCLYANLTRQDGWFLRWPRL